ncbi:hypothetical protein [Streptomyces litchfieldiae]|uniref:Uncharacterized protein n=1 Tax=Streptomyces litchfieldiae TaxID=3075543 RepID=A0ABU2MU36_9ACTN|nr:hypothetical protein [Streptomyces sp. DSM 44938]MDT0345154.1 hypothetical protein [Streptomyces sp. DSM 44938]
MQPRHRSRHRRRAVPPLSRAARWLGARAGLLFIAINLVALLSLLLLAMTNP